ncbi:MAG: thermonuclease family protein [Gammaproteobacteria bacterium]|nr:thermonuclease family protein [Gammaproteobacteria bacterium]
MRLLCFNICIFVTIVHAAVASEIRGIAEALSADTLLIDGQTIQLRGVAAPEPNQSCQNGTNDWLCGRSALDAVARQIASNSIRCTELVDESGDTRISAICFANTQTNSLNKWIVENGWALAGSVGDLTKFEQQARQAGLGIWQHNFEPAPRWRLVAETGFEGLISNKTGCDVCSARHSRVKYRKTNDSD